MGSLEGFAQMAEVGAKSNCCVVTEALGALQDRMLSLVLLQAASDWWAVSIPAGKISRGCSTAA